MPLLAQHAADADPIGRAEHALRTTNSALTVVDVDQLPADLARRFAALRTEAAVLANEFTGPRVTYRRGDVVTHGCFIAEYSTSTTAAIRTSDGHVSELSTEGEDWDLFRRGGRRPLAVAA